MLKRDRKINLSFGNSSARKAFDASHLRVEHQLQRRDERGFLNYFLELEGVPEKIAKATESDWVDPC
jgi:hypothetical protein